MKHSNQNDMLRLWPHVYTPFTSAIKQMYLRQGAVAVELRNAEVVHITLDEGQSDAAGSFFSANRPHLRWHLNGQSTLSPAFDLHQTHGWSVEAALEVSSHEDK